MKTGVKEKKNILLGVCGGISAYKSAELVRLFQKGGFQVRVVMTQTAEHFIGPLTFEALTRHQVYRDLFDDDSHGTAHIDLARWADLIVVAPATANTIAKLAHGYASDFLSTVVLAYQGPLVLAPAMNTKMWDNARFQKNLESVQTPGTHVVMPTTGELACGELGIGRMADPEMIYADVDRIFKQRRTLKGKHIVITAGPTREYLDPVRYISSPSTGKMGVAIAREAAFRGANVSLIHGPIQFTKDFKAQFYACTSAKDMMARLKALEKPDVFIGAAAIADYRPISISKNKIKKIEKKLHLKLERCEDLLAFASKNRKKNSVYIGFAAETENIEDYAKKKLKGKNLDLIVANKVFYEKEGFVQNMTDVLLITKSTVDRYSSVSKADVARHLMDRVEQLLSRSKKSRKPSSQRPRRKNEDRQRHSEL